MPTRDGQKEGSGGGGGGGDITAVGVAGPLLTGGGTSGAVTVTSITSGAPAWTGSHSFNPGTSQGTPILLDMAQPGSAGQRDSHTLEWRGTSFDSSGHNADWRMFADVTSNAGASGFVLQTRKDAASFATVLTVADTGLMTVTGKITGLTQATATTDAVAGGRTLTAGTGISAIGLGDLTADRTINVDTTVIATKSYVDTQDTGVLATVAATYVPLTRTLTGGTGISAIGTLAADRTIAVDTTVIATRSYADTGDAAAVSSAASSAAALYVPLTRTLTAGAGLTGAGTLAADRTFDVGQGVGITVNANDVAVDQSFAPTWTGSHTFNKTVALSPLTTTVTAAASTILQVTPSSHTVSDNAEVKMLDWNGSAATLTLGLTGTLANERMYHWQPSSLANGSGQTITNLFVHQFDAPQIGANITPTSVRILRAGSDIATIPSTAGFTYSALSVGSHTVTMSGTTAPNSTGAIVSAIRLNPITVTDASALVIPIVATLHIVGPPVAAGSVTFTETDALYIEAGNVVSAAGNLTLSSGNLVLTSGNTTLTSGSLTLTSGNATISNGAITDTIADNGTTTVTFPVIVQHRNNAAGTPAAGYGVGQQYKLDSSARTLRTAAQTDVVWTTATDGSEQATYRVLLTTGGTLQSTTATAAFSVSGTAGGVLTAADAAAATQIDALTITHSSTTNATAGVGVGLMFNVPDSAQTVVNIARIVGTARVTTAGATVGQILFQHGSNQTMTTAAFISGSILYGTSLAIGSVNATGVVTNTAIFQSTGGLIQLGNSSASNGGISITGTVNTSGARSFFCTTPSANTAITTATERITHSFGSATSSAIPTLASIVQTWANGTVALQRENVWTAPTYLQTSGTNVMTMAVHHDFGTTPIITGTTNSLTGARIARFGGSAAVGVTAATTTYVGIELVPSTITYTGSTQVTSTVAASQMRLDILTLTDASAVTIDTAATLDIVGAPAAAGSVTLTNKYGLLIRAGGMKVTGNMGFNGAAPTGQGTNGADLTNNVTAGGVDNTIADITDITTYSNAGAGAAIRNDIYQLARKLKQVSDYLRLRGDMT